MARTVALAGLVPVGFQTLTLSNSTALALNSTIRANANVLDISVETNDARYRADGTDPTLNTGVLLTTGSSPYRLDGFNGTANLSFQRATGTCTISVMGYEQKGVRS